ncbi:MAG: SprT family zinc-dependent metalloprotease [Flavobacteriales bacterium]|nr:SprT family zinc-dependent metalloprotease [Flavobacteriales bacterium]
MESKRARYERILQRYLPGPFVEMVIDLLMAHTVQFKIVKPRKTKLGDFRANNKHGKTQITINGDLNPYSFLVTTLHEFAHLTNFLEFGHRVAPHGKEWKLHYTRLLLPVIDHSETPEVLRVALLKSTTNMKASSCTDQQLQRTLLTFDSRNDNLLTLEKLPKNCTFALSGKTFEKGILRRTRYLCTDVNSKRQYLVSALAHVELIENEEQL